MISRYKIIEHLGLKNIPKADIIFVLICLAICIILIFMPSGFEGAKDTNGVSVPSEVINVDNSQIHVIGLIKTGEQIVTIKILKGEYKGRVVETINHFLGKLDLDKFYVIGDKVFTVIEKDEKGDIFNAKIIDRYRLNIEAILVGIFILFLLFYAGWTGFKALVSFFFTALIIWKVLLPGYLKYYPPILFSIIVVGILTWVIIFLVAGFTKKGFVAFLGAFSGVLLTCLLSILFGKLFVIPGEIKPFAETLLYTGFIRLNLSDIFLAGVFIASSGAVMDIAMDISASMSEIINQKPEIKAKELILSGFAVGKSVVGTMTTTLLLAYSGGYSTLLMIFIAQGIPISNILNIQYVSAEIMYTVVGSFGLVAVAPLTAMIGGFIYVRFR
ncbi:MAG: YibE/F family protein [Desulfobacterales bacterium]|nr:YibE/F family protein [Desulfobacterales bacterium]